MVKRLPAIGELVIRAKNLGHREKQRIRDAPKSPYERWMAHRRKIRRGFYPVQGEAHGAAVLSFVTWYGIHPTRILTSLGGERARAT